MGQETKIDAGENIKLFNHKLLSQLNCIYLKDGDIVRAAKKIS